MLQTAHLENSNELLVAIYLVSSLKYLLKIYKCAAEEKFKHLIYKLEARFPNRIKLVKKYTLPPIIPLHTYQKEVILQSSKDLTKLFSKIGSIQLDSTKVDLLVFIADEYESIIKQDLDNIYYLLVLSHCHIQKILGMSFFRCPLLLKECFEKTLRQWRLKKKVIKEKHLREYLGLLDAVRYLHLKNLVHNKINPDTVVVNIRSRFALSNFEKCSDPNTTDEDLDDQLCYIAPEKVLFQYVGLEGDIWSLGCVLCFLIECQDPFSGITDRNSYMNEVVYRKTSPSLNTENHFYPLVRKMLKLRPDRRITSAEAFNEFEKILLKNYPRIQAST